MQYWIFIINVSSKSKRLSNQCCEGGSRSYDSSCYGGKSGHIDIFVIIEKYVAKDIQRNTPVAMQSLDKQDLLVFLKNPGQ
jgi:hypothetical protein